MKRKLERFLSAALRVYRVPEEEQQRVLAFIDGLNMTAIAEKAMQRLFEQLEMKYDFTLTMPEGIQ